MKRQARVPGAVAGSVLPSFEFLFLWCIFLRRSPASATGASFVFLTSSLCKGEKKKLKSIISTDLQTRNIPKRFAFDAFIILKTLFHT